MFSEVQFLSLLCWQGSVGGLYTFLDLGQETENYGWGRSVPRPPAPAPVCFANKVLLALGLAHVLFMLHLGRLCAITAKTVPTQPIYLLPRSLWEKRGLPLVSGLFSGNFTLYPTGDGAPTALRSTRISGRTALGGFHVNMRWRGPLVPFTAGCGALAVAHVCEFLQR